MTGERVVLPDADRARLSVIVLTYNRADRVLDTLARLAALPDRIEIVAVNNASTDGTAEHIAANFPFVKLVRAPRNLGAAGRNLGVARVQTEYVAFCDDDTWWSPGSLSRAVDVLDAAPRVGVLNARVIVGEHGAIDETCERMRDSPLARDGLPGPRAYRFHGGRVRVSRGRLPANGRLRAEAFHRRRRDARLARCASRRPRDRVYG
jgi:glycosyltransferase involved in cell wall biosynthesis